MGRFRIKELEHISNTGLQNDEHPAFGEAIEKIGKWAERNNMGEEKFELFLTHCVNNYDAGGREMAFHFDNAKCRSRRRERWVSEVDATSGRRLRMGDDRRFGGWGVEKCTNLLKGSAKNTLEVVARDRCARSIRELGDGPLPNSSLDEMRREVERALAKGGRGAKLADALQHLVVKTSADQRYAAEAILDGYWRREERAPPYEKRLNCT